MRRGHALLLALLAAAPAACAGVRGPSAAPGTPRAEDFAPLLAAADRTAEDRALDPGRHPAELLAFLEVRPGLRVAELGAAEGYTAELLVRAVGPGGTVYGQNTRTLLAQVGDVWGRRLARPVMSRLLRVDRELAAPLPPEATGLDLVVMNATYHDTLWLDVDRARMNRAIFEALRPGGVYAVIDSSARAGAGREEAYLLHRVDQALVLREVEAAGFQLAGESGFLRNAADQRDWSAAPNEAGERRGTSDRFALRFVRP